MESIDPKFPARMLSMNNTHRIIVARITATITSSAAAETTATSHARVSPSPALRRPRCFLGSRLKSALTREFRFLSQAPSISPRKNFGIRSNPDVEPQREPTRRSPEDADCDQRRRRKLTWAGFDAQPCRGKPTVDEWLGYTVIYRIAGAGTFSKCDRHTREGRADGSARAKPASP